MPTNVPVEFISAHGTYYIKKDGFMKLQHFERTNVFFFPRSVLYTLVFNRRSIDLSGAQEKEGDFHYKNFLRASK